jgi:hypothetical protein
MKKPRDDDNLDLYRGGKYDNGGQNTPIFSSVPILTMALWQGLAKALEWRADLAAYAVVPVSQAYEFSSVDSTMSHSV